MEEADHHKNRKKSRLHLAQPVKEVVDAGDAGVRIFGLGDPVGEEELGGVGLFKEEGFHVGFVVEEPFKIIGEWDDPGFVVGFQFNVDRVAVAFTDGHPHIHGHRQPVGALAFGDQTLPDHLTVYLGLDFNLSCTSELFLGIIREDDIIDPVFMSEEFPSKAIFFMFIQNHKIHVF